MKQISKIKQAMMNMFFFTAEEFAVFFAGYFYFFMKQMKPNW